MNLYIEITQEQLNTGYRVLTETIDNLNGSTELNPSQLVTYERRDYKVMYKRATGTYIVLNPELTK